MNFLPVTKIRRFQVKLVAFGNGVDEAAGEIDSRRMALMAM